MEIKLERKRYQEELDLAASLTQSDNPKVLESYRRSLLSTIYDIDHSEGDESAKYFRAEASFTILDWLVQDELLTNKKIKIDNLHWKRRL